MFFRAATGIEYLLKMRNGIAITFSFTREICSNNLATYLIISLKTTRPILKSYVESYMTLTEIPLVTCA